MELGELKTVEFDISMIGFSDDFLADLSDWSGAGDSSVGGGIGTKFQTQKGRAEAACNAR